ncbi:MAG: hypothetical protein AAF715_12985 [Myxococcota bacterium]
MGFTRLAAPRVVASLEASVVAFASLGKARRVAALTTDPVHLHVMPLTGSGSAKTTVVALDEARGLALLNPDVAVVLTDDALWSLRDIRHQVRVEVVARDVRALCAHPAGGHALAFGWDGRGIELTAGGDGVDARDFVTRGDIRSAVLSGDHALVAMAGAGGGEGPAFRCHPGTTPESGAVGRADLPLAAAGCDRLRGGPALAVLASPGATEVVLVSGGAMAAPSVGTVDLGHEVVDVGVVETTLFTLGADGRVRMFDGITPDATGAATPTAEVALGLRGRPTAFHATSAGGARLWGGSDQGEVVCVAAAKGTL